MVELLDISSESRLTSNAAAGVDIGVDQRHLALEAPPRNAAIINIGHSI